jgi:cytochrome P450
VEQRIWTNISDGDLWLCPYLDIIRRDCKCFALKTCINLLRSPKNSKFARQQNVWRLSCASRSHWYFPLGSLVTVAYANYSKETWKRQRKLGQQLMSRSANSSLYAYPTIECKRFLYNISQNSSNYIEHIEEYTSRTISRLAWGSPDHTVELRRGTFGLLKKISPSGAVPNVVSWLAHLPSWLSPWKEENARHEREKDFFRKQFHTAKESNSNCEGAPCYTRIFLDEQEKGGHADAEGQYVIGMMAIAGALKIGSPLQNYILAMCHHPEWQVKIREEVEQVCGARCPEWEDRHNLPTLRAVVKEIVRWRPPVPTGIPHRLEKDDIYNGYFIPSGATIHALEWYYCLPLHPFPILLTEDNSGVLHATQKSTQTETVSVLSAGSHPLFPPIVSH